MLGEDGDDSKSSDSGDDDHGDTDATGSSLTFGL